MSADGARVAAGGSRVVHVVQAVGSWAVYEQSARVCVLGGGGLRITRRQGVAPPQYNQPGAYHARRTAVTSRSVAGDPGATGKAWNSERWNCRSMRSSPASPLSKATSAGNAHGECYAPMQRTQNQLMCKRGTCGFINELRVLPQPHNLQAR